MTALSVRRGSDLFEDIDYDLPGEFEELHHVLGDFFKVVDRGLEAERKAAASLRKFLDSPDDESRNDVIQKIDNLGVGG